MDSIFAKTILFIASILTVLNSPNYIKVGSDNLVFDFKTGQNYPIYYYLNVQNAGPGTERFEISSKSDWVSVYREGTSYDFVELPSQAYINFVLEIHPERLADGANETKIKLMVLDIDSLVSQEVVLDEEEVSVTVNKNFVLTPSPTAAVSPSPLPTQSPSPAAHLSLTPLPTILLSPSPVSPKITPIKTLTVSTKPIISLIPAPTPASISSVPAVDKDLNPILKSLRLLIDSLRILLGRFF